VDAVRECNVKVEVFEGPLDLLLHLIKQNEIDIYDIPMALITQQYLEYLNWMQSLNLDVASDYLVMAATLVHIKSRMLLPVSEDPEEEEDEEKEDPRAELVRRLLEYQRFKEAGQQLGGHQLLGRDVFVHPAEGPTKTTNDPPPLEEANLFVLLDAFRKLVASRPWQDTDFQIDLERVSLADRITEIAQTLAKNPGGVAFEDLFSGDLTKERVVMTFLALLEMIRLRMVKAHQATIYGTIRIVQAVENGRSPAEPRDSR
jgi:segregation and condensation protein A